MKANIGITGANAVTASGEVVLLENEGNISKVSRLPEHHIVLTGVEKIVENLSEAMHVLKCSSVWGTGQDWPAYVSVIAGPSKTADIQNELVVGAQGAQRATVILLDNGRTAMLEKYPDLWRCINCGACLNFCPAYYQLMEKFGYKYLGAKGILWTAFNEGLETAKNNGLYDCTTCEACWKSCPADINLPEYIRELRNDVIKAGYETDGNKEMMEHVRKHGNPFGEVEEGEIPKKLYCC
jgi:L-lactate utilization protein LutB